MNNSGYFTFLTELPHLILILALGFMALFFFSPFLVSLFYPPIDSLNILLIFTYYWKNILVAWSGLNAVFYSFLLLGVSYLLGFIITGLYDFFGLGSFLLDEFGIKCYGKILEYQKKGYHKVIEQARKPTRYDIGTSEYANFQFDLYHPYNKHLRSYYNWEFIKDVSCQYIAFIIVIFWIIFSFYLLFYFTGWFVQISENINITLKSIVFIYLFTLIAFLGLEYGHLFYGSARVKARLELYNRLNP